MDIHDPDLIYRIPTPAPLAFAVLSGLLVFAQASHPWTLESLRSRTLYRTSFTITLVVLHFTIVSVTFSYWVNPHRWSYVALRILLECSWLNGISGPILIFWKLSKDGPRTATTSSAAAAVLIQILGFGISMKSDYGLRGRTFMFAGAFLFHLNAAIGVNYLNSKHWGRRVRVKVFKVTFTLAAFAVVAIQVGYKDNDDWSLLANNILECLVNSVLIALQLIRCYIQSIHSRSQEDAENMSSGISLHIRQGITTKKYDAHLYLAIH
ncbi:hypothetical protein PMIN01_11871 [Paraphaeosphaeria minitans]|uniref:Uncharacterized protein n=1 Tax=Paraphaeosphaeria minitans TaxID=565426 RepID=A0A9P6KK03_9PLEO|nr:hypothetical protein PMIN01_11871 [Paraphaeosphaeria minitans]